MVLQASGEIDASDINTEIGLPPINELSLNDSFVRKLASKPTGTEISYTNFYGKSASGLALWAVSMESINDLVSSSVDVDSNGNIYMAGRYGSAQVIIYNSKNIDSGLTLNANTNSSSYYVIKFDSDGVPQWAVTTVADGVNDCSVAVDLSGNVYLAGTINNAAVILKYDSSGIALWSAKVDGTTFDRGKSVATDANGNVYLAGSTGGNSSSGNIVYNADNSTAFTFPTANAAFVVKYNSSGYAQWGVRVDSGGTDDGLSVHADASGNVYLAGYYSPASQASSAIVYNAANVSSGFQFRVTSQVTGVAGAFAVKWNSSGQMQWGVSVDSTGNDYGYAITVDSSGNVYLAGSTSAVIAKVYSANNVDSGISIPAATASGVFVVKYTPSGAAIWAARIDSAGSDVCYGIAVDPNSNVYLTGIIGGTATVYNSNNTIALSLTTGSGSFLASYNSDGNSLWASTVSTGGMFTGGTISISNSGHIYISGRYSAGAIIYNKNNENSGLSLRTPSGTTVAAYLIKYKS